MELSGSAVLVAGGASGLGEATARLAAARGARVVVADRNGTRGPRVAADIGGAFAMADITSEGDVISAVELACTHGPLRALVVTAGIGIGREIVGPDKEYSSAHSLESFNEVLQINLLGSFNCARIAATAMSRLDPIDASGERGALLLTSSEAGFGGSTGQAAYSAAKSGLHGLVVTLADEFAVHGIRVNLMVPGTFDTPIFDSVPGGEDVKASLAARRAFPRRLGRPAEYASLALEALTNSYMNGSLLSINGGDRRTS